MAHLTDNTPTHSPGRSLRGPFAAVLGAATRALVMALVMAAALTVLAGLRGRVRDERGSHTTDVALWIGFVIVVAGTVYAAYKLYIGTLLGKFT